MSEVNIEINGRKYRMACEDGQEEHLMALADRFNTQVERYRGTFGEIGDNRLTVMAGIAVMDSLVEAERRISDLEDEIGDMKSAAQLMSDEASALESRFAERMVEVAERVEAAASAIDSIGRGEEQDA